MVSIILSASSAAGLGRFDNLQPDQLNLGATVLQHLLSRGQHLILDNDNTSRGKQLHLGAGQTCGGTRTSAKTKTGFNNKLIPSGNSMTLQFTNLRMILRSLLSKY